ncbi:flavodoxin family protein [Clostridium pasteurianum]|uniref:Multimeric flavodoxin WrbA n=1 Tax=Clostridium pasteurianum BC1 TaxID=86416 RepID=R4K9Y3_CLOPA|nr:NAD(P)H-dependent oxidoreductase [Clostridium pasteurianum]AGK99383.1 multimeric flavodoxin WrbA [Clostridium pasteurianum BC1]
MKIIAIMGNIRENSQTKKIIQMFQVELERYKQIDFKYIELRKMNLQLCRGCALCLERGEELCPLKDDYNIILDKIKHADGIILATPNYALQVTHLLKNYLDRSAYIMHRPIFFGKVFTSIVAQGAYGGESINKYLDSVSSMIGGVVIKGITITVPEGSAYNNRNVWSDLETNRVENSIKRLARKFIKQLYGNRYPKPTLFKLLIFRFARGSHKYSKCDNRDNKYFKERGWFHSEYYYDTKINIFKWAFGMLIDIYQKQKNK